VVIEREVNGPHQSSQKGKTKEEKTRRNEMLDSEDRVVFLFVFVPILRDEIATFVETWNEHRIRSQRNRANHVAGIPNELYTSDDTPSGWLGTAGARSEPPLPQV
jgi:hypothetical protein